MLTREQKIKIFEARLDGRTLEDIGRAYGISRQRVFQILRDPTEGSTKRYARDDVGLVIYPAVRAWIDERKINLNQFCAEASSNGYHVRARTIHDQLIGLNKLRMPTKNAVLALTGMHPEVAFELPDEE